MKFSRENLLLAQQELCRDFNISKTIDEHQLLEELSQQINHLINTDFSRLVSILYRIDISEHTLRAGLKEQPDKNAGMYIAQLILERQLQKQEMRGQCKPPHNIPDNEKW